VIVDPYVFEMIFGTTIGNFLISRDPVWTQLIAASSGGKSTLIAPIADIGHTHFLDDLTDKTFLSGFQGPKGTESSLLLRIGNGMLCFSDFTTILAKDQQSSGELLSQLRMIYDGRFEKYTGQGKLISWTGRMGFLGACTPDIYHRLEQARSLGERFMYYTITQPTDRAIVEKQQTVTASSQEISKIMGPMYSEYFGDVRDFMADHGLPKLIMTPEQIERVHSAAIFCVAGKASIVLDFKTKKPIALANKPGVGRDRKMFNNLLHALQLMYAYETGDPKAPVQEDHIRIIEKCAWSSINRERRKCLEILSASDVPLKSSVIGATDSFGLAREAIETIILPLFAAGIVQRRTSGNAFVWSIDTPEIKAFVRRVTDNPIPEIASEGKTEEQQQEQAYLQDWFDRKE